MSPKIQFEITTPERIVYQDEVDQVTLPTREGEITILPNHIPLVSILSPGELKIKKNEEIEYLAVSGGFIEVQPNKVVVLADTAEKAEEIDIEKAEEARKRAQTLAKEKRFDREEFATLTAKIERELARLKVGQRRKSARVERAIGPKGIKIEKPDPSTSSGSTEEEEEK